MRLRSAIALLIALCAITLTIAIIYCGVFDVAANVPHTRAVYKFLQIVRDRSVAIRASEVEVPSLADPRLIATSAKDYAAMCP